MRQIVLAAALLLGTVALASAQEDQPDPTPQPEGLPLLVYPQHMVSGTWEPLELEPVVGAPMPSGPTAPPAEDNCSLAPELTFVVDAGGVTQTNNMSESATDPLLPCMWGSPGNPGGYRTVWYQFTPVRGGWVTIDTAGSSYDTVLAIHTGTCGALVLEACNDDSNGFTSRVSLPVVAGLTYYVEVADWHLGVTGDATLNVANVMDMSTSWESAPNSNAAPRSRHAAVPVGENIYVIGGQAIVSGNPVRTPRTDVYNTPSGTWTELAGMLAGDDGLGYSNTTAAYVNGKIYLPSGYVGDNNNYDGTHWVYDIASNSWSKATPNTWAGGTPAIYSAAVSTGSTTFAPGYYLVGGLTGPNQIVAGGLWQPRDELYFYAPSVPSHWFQGPSMRTGRFGHAAGLQQINGRNYLCVVGGIGLMPGTLPQSVLLSSGECYDINSGVWSIVTGPLNVPRYFAGSAVGPDGNWYVFGGTDRFGNSVAVTEQYNRFTNSWVTLDGRYNLGSGTFIQPSTPARAWPRGGFVDQTLWAVFGQFNDPSSGDQVVNLVEKVFIPAPDLFTPVVAKSGAPGEPNNTFGRALPIPLNQTINRTFAGPDDFVDVFFIDLPSPRRIEVGLRKIALGSDYSLWVYSSNKVVVGASRHVGNVDEIVTQNVPAGRYFIMVVREFPVPGADPGDEPYELLVQG